MKRKIIYTILILFILSIAGFFILNYIFLKGNIKGLIEQKISEAIHRPVTIEEIKFQIPQGLSVKNIKIYQKDAPTELLASVDNLSCSIIIPGIFLNKQIIISSIKVIHPVVNLIKNSKDNWNFSDLLTPPENNNAPQQKNAFGVLVRTISIEEGQIHVQDNSRQTPWEESFENINLEAAFIFISNLNYTFSVVIPNKKASIQSKGSYDIAQKNFSSQSSFNNIYLSEYLPLAGLTLPVEIKNGIFHSLGINVSYKNNAVQADGEITLDQMDLQTSDTQRLQGDITAKQLSFKMDGDKIQAKGLININTANFVLAEQTSLQGDVALDIQDFKFAPNHISLKGNASLKNKQSQILPRIQISKDQELKGSLDILNIDMTLENTDITAKADILMKPFSLAINPTMNITGDLSAKINSIKTTATDKTISLQGDFLVDNTTWEGGETQKFQGTIKADNIILSMKDKDIQVSGDLKANNVYAQLNKDQTLKCDVSTENTNLSLKDNKIDLQTNFDIKNTLLSLGESQSFQGDISSPQTTLSLNNGAVTAKTTLNVINGIATIGQQKFQGNPKLSLSYAVSGAEQAPQYAGTLSLTDISATGLPTIESISSLKGNILFDQDHLETKLLTLNTNNIFIESSGSVQNFLNPFLDIKIKTSDIILEDILKLFPDIMKKAGVDLKGKAILNASYKGLLKTPLEADAQVVSQIKDVFIKSDKLPSEISNISGEIEYQKNLLTFKAISGFFQGKRYNINGQVTNFSNPSISVDIISDDIKAAAQINILNQAFQITKLKANYLNSSCDIHGNIFLKDNAEPTVDLQGMVTINIADLRNFLAPATREQIYQLKPLGTISLEGLFQGSPTNWHDWTLTFKATSSRISLMNYGIENVVMNFSQQNQNISICNLSATIYGGNLNVASTADLTKNTIPLKLSLAMQGLDLALLQKDAQTPLKNLAGLTSISLQASGPALDLNKIKGDASLSIEDGNLGQIIPEFRNTIFNAASADFMIQDGRFTTENATIKSNIVDLKAKGWIDFAKNVNFDISPSSNQNANDAGKINLSLPSLIEKGFVIKITGSIDKIKYKLEPIPMKILENTTGAVTDVIKSGINILEGLF